MNPAQIMAIVSLLMAFQVPQPTVDVVQGILQNANQPVQTAPVGQTFGSVTPAPEQTTVVESPQMTQLHTNPVDCTLTSNVSAVQVPNWANQGGEVTPKTMLLTWTTTNATRATIDTHGQMYDPNAPGGIDLPNGNRHVTTYNIPASQLASGSDSFAIALDMLGRTETVVLTAYDDSGNLKQCSIDIQSNPLN